MTIIFLIMTILTMIFLIMNDHDYHPPPCMATVSSSQCLYAASLVYTPGMVASHGAGPKLTIPT